MMFFYWCFTRVMGGLFGMLVLRAHDEGLWDDALLKGAMAPPPTPEARMRFLVMCVFLPELPLAGLIYAWATRDQ